MKIKTNYERLSLLAVLAHPDDETFGMGGTLAVYASRGVDVYLVCATRGEVGEIDPEFMEKFQSPACLRTQELKCAAEVLGIRKVFFLNYRDSGMAGSKSNLHAKALVAQPLEEVAHKVTHYIRKLKPDVVLTFDPIGGYRHPDHIAIHKATVRAFDLAADGDHFDDPEGLAPFQAARLYFYTINNSFLRKVVFVLQLLGKDPHHYGRNKDIDIASIAAQRFPTHVRINYGQVAEIRAKAVACHASQGGADMNKGLQGLIMRMTNQKRETFMQAFPIPGEKQPISDDLFAGLEK